MSSICDSIFCFDGEADTVDLYCKAARKLTASMLAWIPSDKKPEDTVLKRSHGDEYMDVYADLQDAAWLLADHVDADHALLHIAAIGNLDDFLAAVETL